MSKKGKMRQLFGSGNFNSYKQYTKDRLIVTIAVLSVLGVGLITLSALFSDENDASMSGHTDTKTMPLDNSYDAVQHYGSQEKPIAADLLPNDTENMSLAYISYDGSLLYVFNAQTSEYQVVVEYPKNTESNDYRNDRLLSASVSPYGKYVVFTHASPQESSFSYSYLKGKMSMYNMSTNEVVPVIDVVENSYTHFEWSDDGMYYSYIVNDGQRAEIRSVDGAIITVIDDGSVQPIVWLGDDEVSFIQEEDLYRGTVSDPRKTVVVDDALKNLGAFERPGRMMVPMWNDDGNVLVYESSRGKLVALDTTNGAEVILGDVSTSIDYYCATGSCAETDEAPNVLAYPLGWMADGSFAFSENEGLNKSRYVAYDYMSGNVSSGFESSYDDIFVVAEGSSVLPDYTSINKYQLTEAEVLAEKVGVIEVFGALRNDAHGSRCVYNSDYLSSVFQWAGGASTSLSGLDGVRLKALSSSGVALIEIGSGEASAIEVADLVRCENIMTLRL